MYLTPFMLSQNIALDNALSTIQVIHQLISKVNDVIEELNNINVTANDYTDEQIKKLTLKIDTDLNALEKTLKAYSDTGIENLKEYVDTDIASLRSDFNTIILNIRTEIQLLEKSLKAYSDLGDSNLKVYINSLYDELLNLIKNGNNLIYSPIDGDLKSVKDAIFDIANIVQQKNGVNWQTLETLCRADYSLTGYTKINSDYDMYYNGGEYATIDYLNVNGLYIVCQNAIRSLTIDGESSTIFEGSGVLIPIATLQKFETLIVITDMNNNVTHYSILNLDYALKPVTYNSWANKLNTLLNFNNWYSFAFYTCFFLRESLTRTDGTPVDIKNQIQYMSLLNTDFYNLKGE